MNDYQEQALRTKSDEFHADKAPAWMFVAVLGEIIEHVRDLDALKKALFYGKPLPPGLASELARRVVLDEDEEAMVQGVMEAIDRDVLHGIVGIITEAGELAELLADPPDDPAKVAEEVGDLMWYEALLLDGLGYGTARVQQMNINKLRKRYPEKFSSEAALARADEQA